MVQIMLRRIRKNTIFSGEGGFSPLAVAPQYLINILFGHTFQEVFKTYFFLYFTPGISQNFCESQFDYSYKIEVYHPVNSL